MQEQRPIGNLSAACISQPGVAGFCSDLGLYFSDVFAAVVLYVITVLVWLVPVCYAEWSIRIKTPQLASMAWRTHCLLMHRCVQKYMCMAFTRLMFTQLARLSTQHLGCAHGGRNMLTLQLRKTQTPAPNGAPHPHWVLVSCSTGSRVRVAVLYRALVLCVDVVGLFSPPVKMLERLSMMQAYASMCWPGQ